MSLTINKPKLKINLTKKKEEDKEEVVQQELEGVEELSVEEEATEETEVKEEELKETDTEVEEEETPEEEKQEKSEKTEETVEDKKESKEDESDKEETEEEEKPKKTTRKRTTKKKEEEEQKEVIQQTRTSDSVKYNDTVAEVVHIFKDEEWDEFIESATEEINSIEITEDMEIGAVRLVISELSVAREKISKAYVNAKNHYESISGKQPEGLIEQVKMLNCEGRNDHERKRSMVNAVSNYTVKGKKINLYDLLDEARRRYFQVNELKDIIEYKTRILITVSAALKLEKDHIVRGD